MRITLSQGKNGLMNRKYNIEYNIYQIISHESNRKHILGKSEK